ncbi:MAG: CpaF family protein [Selenomonadaceae bacterium]|nr:CpaF family protein [Selenomonadaceae bacterium]
MGLLERLGGRQNAELRSQAEILSAAKGEAQTSRVQSAFDENLPSRKVETFTGYRPTDTSESTYQQLKLKIHRQIVSEMSADEQELLAGSGRSREEIQEIVAGYCHRAFDEQASIFSRGERLQIIADICDEILGLGPIEPLLKDSTITEVMINGASRVYVEQAGKLYRTDVRFHDETHLMNIIEKILAPLGRRIDESAPMVDARLADGSRVNIIIPPLALDGAMVTIRKFSKSALKVQDLINFGTLDERMAIFLEASVKARLNILVSGGTGSGKTTTLNTLSSFIPDDDRIVTIEDAAELKLQQDHVVRLESRPPNIEGEGAIAIRDLVRNALRMRPDRIIVGEVRSGEALDMLQAMNTGHDGSLTTAHANTPRDALSRLETMVLMAGMELPVRAIRTQISAAIDLILQQSRIRDGSRKITHISEVQGMEGDTIVMQDLFVYVQDYIDERGKSVGHFEATGLQPSFLDKFKINGVDLPLEIFEADGGRG